MCSILGGTVFDERAQALYTNAKSRGHDFSGMKQTKNGCWIANHRAIPTTELENPISQQPFGNVDFLVHNGVIANDVELGRKDGEVDSSVLLDVLDISTLEKFHSSLDLITGSFAIAVLKTTGEFYLGCNFKPIFVAHFDDGNKFFSSLESHFPAEWAKYARIYRVPPYSVTLLGDPTKVIPLPRIQGDSALVIASGGLDSTVVASLARARHKNVTLLHFKYGCNAEEKEVYCIRQIAERIGADVEILELPMGFANSASTLLQKDSQPTEGIAGTEYAHEWVPARNLVMLSMATAYAEAKQIGHIYLGTNLEEGGAYPDNEEQFIEDFRSLLWGAVQNGVKIEVHTPLGGLMKHEIVHVGNVVGAPMDLTHSCYTDNEFPCEECGPCFMRATAFARNGLNDPLLDLKEFRNEK